MDLSLELLPECYETDQSRAKEEQGGEFGKRYVDHEFFVGSEIVCIRQDINV